MERWSLITCCDVDYGIHKLVLFWFLFFFKQKTAYEIVDCDWSSDVCSSDLNVGFRQNYNTTSQSDIALTKVDRSAYSGTANKATVGTPSQFWVQRFIDRVTVTIYPLPNATAAAATSKLMVYYVKRIQDVGAFSNATDTPFRFVPCMVSGLSYLLSQKFAPERTQELKLFYEDDLARALSEDGSPSSTYITPKTYYPNI